MFTTVTSLWLRLIPEADQRIPLNSSNFYVLFAPWPASLLMGYLVRRPNTHILRMMLCPIVIAQIIHSYFHYYWLQPNLNVYNWGAALLGFAMIARALEFAFLPKGRLKVGEVSPGCLATPAISKQPGYSNGNAHPHAEESRKNPIARGLLDSLEVLCAMRGIGWQDGTDLYIPPYPQTVSRLIKHAIIGFLSLDFIDSTFKLFPQFQNPVGGSIFDSALSPPYRYLESTFLHFLTGCGFMAGFDMMYSISALLCVALFNHEPSSWPPVLDKPWVSTSLHEYWAFRWHQLLRQTFLVFGGFPLSYIFSFNRTLSQIALILGTFFASGLFHSLSIYSMGQGRAPHINTFFFAQGLGLIIERVWRKATGYRVGGWLGLIWVYTCIIGGGQLCVDSFHRHGLGGGLVIPPVMSPFRQIVFPFLFKLIS